MEMSQLRSHILLKGPSAQLHRVVWFHPESERIYLLDVSGEMPRGSRMPVPVEPSKFARDHGEEWTVADASLMPATMQVPISELSIAAARTREKNWSIIKHLVDSQEALLRTLDKQTRPLVISQAAEAASVTIPRIYQLLTRYFWFGSDERALTPQYKSRGSKKISSGQTTRTKRGAPNAVVKLEGDTAYSGRSVTKRDLNKFAEALKQYWAGDMLSIPQTYERMCDKLYVSSNQHKKQGSFEHFVSQRFLPTLEQFRYHSKSIIAELGLREKRIGHMDWAQRMMSRTGSATDITIGPTDVYDMDVVELKCIAVTETNPPETIGKVNACLAVDRGSRAITGFYFFLGKESWDHYRLTLFRAFTSTKKYLEQLGYLDLAERANSFAADGWCNEVYVDRGPARGHEAFDAIVESLRLGRAAAPKDRGDMKAVVESVNGRFQKQVSTLQGGYSRVAGTRKSEQAESAAKVARLTVNQISRFLAAAIADHNAYHNVPNLLTRQMVLAKVQAVPVEIFKWGQNNVIGGTARDYVPDDELYLRLLPTFESTITKSGIRYKGYHYSSDELVKFRHQNLFKKRLKVTINFDKSDPLRLYWRKPSGELGILDINSEGRKKLHGMSGEELHDFRLREQSAIIKRTAKKRKLGFVSHTRKAILQEVEDRNLANSTDPLLSAEDNKRIGVYQEKKAAREHSRKLLTPEDFDLPSANQDTHVKSSTNKDLTRTSKKLNSVTEQTATSPAIPTAPLNVNKPPEKPVSRAMANFLKKFVPNKSSEGET